MYIYVEFHNVYIHIPESSLPLSSAGGAASKDLWDRVIRLTACAVRPEVQKSSRPLVETRGRTHAQ